jgi:hypothetical protein
MPAEEPLIQAPHTLLLLKQIISSRQSVRNDERFQNRQIESFDRSLSVHVSPGRFSNVNYDYSSDESNLIMSPLFDSPSTCPENSGKYDTTPFERSVGVEAIRSETYINGGSLAPPNDKSLEIWDRFFQNAANVAIEQGSTSTDTSTATDRDNNAPSNSLSNNIATGNTPLHLAAIEGDLKTMSSLLQQGASINVRNQDNQTPIGICFANGFEEGRNLLLKHSHEIHEQEEEWSNTYEYSDNDSLLFHILSWFVRFIWNLFRTAERVKKN